jgi:uncharacterized protein (TIGR00730 family)
MELGAMLADRGMGLVYGGASVGLMGVVADAVLSSGGRVVGVITESLADHEIAHMGLHRLDVVRTMHERKARMAELSDAVIMLPGGFGTYEEFMETVTWVHLGIHDKPCGVLNVDGFFDHLLRFLEHAVEMGFIAPSWSAPSSCPTIRRPPRRARGLRDRPVGLGHSRSVTLGHLE